MEAHDGSLFLLYPEVKPVYVSRLPFPYLTLPYPVPFGTLVGALDRSNLEFR